MSDKIMINMGKRKLGQMPKTSGGTYFITIPKFFVENLGLKRGEDVQLFQDENNNLIFKFTKHFERNTSNNKQQLSESLVNNKL